MPRRVRSTPDQDRGKEIGGPQRFRTALVPQETRFRDWNFRHSLPVGTPSLTTNSGVRMQSPAKFREYAEECKRLAKTAANETDRAALLEIAQAWLGCAEQAERKGKPRRTPVQDH
jgi:hypothetical protein